MPAIRDEPPSLLLGRYEIISELGHGGMATVYRARAAGPMGFEKTLVVKCILPHLAKDPQFVDMFLSEAKLAARLNHPNIVHIFDFGEAEGSYYLAMEYIDGPNLRMLLRRALSLNKPLPLAHCAKIASAACEGLAFAHEYCDPETGEPMNLIHRDISPDNILLARNGSVKLVDFGIAKAANQVHQTRVGTLKGKVPFMAPEQLRNEPFDLRIDVYALGMVLYELVAGRKPFEAGHEAALIQSILYEPFPPVSSRRPDVPEDLRQIIARALAKNPDERYPSCREFQAELDQFLLSLGQPVGAWQLSQLLTQLAVSPVGGGGPPNTPVSGNRFRTGDSGSASRLRRPPTPTPPPPPVDMTLVEPELQEEGPGSNLAAPAPRPASSASAAPALSPSPHGRRWLFPAIGAALLLAALLVVVLGRRGDPEASPPPPPVATALPPTAPSPPPSAPRELEKKEAAPAADSAPPPAAEPKAAEVSPAPVPARPSTIELQVVVTPRKAQALLDNKPLPRLPYTGRYARDGKVHVLRISAPGFTPLVKEVRFEKDLVLDLSLQRKVPESRRPAQAKAAAEEPAEKAEPTVDFPELAPKPAARNARPKRSLDEEDPWDDGKRTPDPQSP